MISCEILSDLMKKIMPNETIQFGIKFLFVSQSVLQLDSVVLKSFIQKFSIPHLGLKILESIVFCRM